MAVLADKRRCISSRGRPHRSSKRGGGKEKGSDSDRKGGREGVRLGTRERFDFSPEVWKCVQFHHRAELLAVSSRYRAESPPPLPALQTILSQRALDQGWTVSGAGGGGGGGGGGLYLSPASNPPSADALDGGGGNCRTQPPPPPLIPEGTLKAPHAA